MAARPQQVITGIPPADLGKTVQRFATKAKAIACKLQSDDTWTITVTFKPA